MKTLTALGMVFRPKKFVAIDAAFSAVGPSHVPVYNRRPDCATLFRDCRVGLSQRIPRPGGNQQASRPRTGASSVESTSGGESVRVGAVTASRPRPDVAPLGQTLGQQPAAS